jgi:hypothetical protein
MADDEVSEVIIIAEWCFYMMITPHLYHNFHPPAMRSVRWWPAAAMRGTQRASAVMRLASPTDIMNG